MLNFFKLREGFASFFALAIFAMCCTYTIFQTAVFLTDQFGVKELAKTTQEIVVTIPHEGKLYTKTYELNATLDDDLTITASSLSVVGETK